LKVEIALSPEAVLKKSPKGPPGRGSTSQPADWGFFQGFDNWLE